MDFRLTHWPGDISVHTLKCFLSCGDKHKDELRPQMGILVSLITHDLFKIWNYFNHTEIGLYLESD